MTMAAISRAFLSILLASMVAGCAALGVLGDASTPLDVYDLRAPDGAPVARGGPLARDVVVELPTSGGVLVTDRIMIRPDELQAQYLPDARWGDEAPVLMQTLLVRTLQNTGGLRYVGRRPLAGSGDFAILTELIDFHADTVGQGEGAQVVIRMTSRIIRESDARVIATRSFTSSARAATTETPVLIRAFDTASDALLIEFADWTMRTLGGRLTPA